MVKDIFISGIDLHKDIGMPIILIEDMVQGGCPCYSINNSNRINTISGTYFPGEPRKIEWRPHESYEEERMQYHLENVRLPIRGVIHHCKEAYGFAASKEFIEKLSSRITNDSGLLDAEKDAPSYANAFLSKTEVKTPGGPTQKELLLIAEKLLKEGRLSVKQQGYVLAFKKRAIPNLHWTRAYTDLPGISGLSKNHKTQERTFYRWAEHGEQICREHATQ